MNVLFAASEALPVIKTGGLADVLGSLPKTLLKLGVNAAVILPLHSKIKRERYSELKRISESYVYMGNRRFYLGILSACFDGVTYYFVDNEDFFGDAIYRGGDAEIEQYLFFCRAVLSSLDFIDFRPDIIHCNDWHTGMIPVLIKTQYQGRLQGSIRTVFTIHNIKFRGESSFKLISENLNIPEKYNTPEFIECGGCANMMKAALVFADRITTVSPRYCEEVKTPYYGMGLDGILRARSRDFRGIINGIDADDFNPKTDPALARNYNSERFILGKRENKAVLTREFGLNAEASAPYISIVSRLTEQKGIDLIQYILEELLSESICFIVLGSGDKQYVDYFNYIAAKYPANTGVFIGYDEALARRIYAGSDLLLMPSLFEPCGLSQLIAQRYGTLPIVRETGGLADTVIPYNKYTGEGNGFSFAPYNAHAMLSAIRLALATYRDKQIFRKLISRAMRKDSGFLASAAKYVELYNNI